MNALIALHLFLIWPIFFQYIKIWSQGVRNGLFLQLVPINLKGNNLDKNSKKLNIQCIEYDHLKLSRPTLTISEKKSDPYIRSRTLVFFFRSLAITKMPKFYNVFIDKIDDPLNINIFIFFKFLYIWDDKKRVKI